MNLVVHLLTGLAISVSAFMLVKLVSWVIDSGNDRRADQQRLERLREEVNDLINKL